MSDEPFALSTIPPALPAEGDYDALRAAVMDSARGRWFLEEYAKRNRQADTQAVLTAIERIEAVIRGERNQHAYQHVRADLLEMAKTIAQTRAEVATATAGPTAPGRDARSASDTASGQTPPPDVFATAERMQEVAWTMRERGIDPSTCAQIEALAASILSASSLRDPGDRRAQQLGEVLHYLERRIDTMLENAAEAVAPGAASEQAALTGEHDRQPAHPGNGLDDAAHPPVAGPHAERAEPAPAAVTEDLPEQAYSAAELPAESQPAAPPEAAAVTTLDAFLARQDEPESKVSTAAAPAVVAVPMDIEPLFAAPVEEPKTETTDSAGEAPSHAALEFEPLSAEPLFEQDDAGTAADPCPAELSAPAAAELAESSAPMPVTTVAPDALIYIADEDKAEPAAPAAPELFFPAVTFDTAPAVETAAIVQDHFVHDHIVQERPAEPEGPAMPEDIGIGSQVQSDLDDLVALPAEPQARPAPEPPQRTAVFDLPAVDVSAAPEPSVSEAEQQAETPSAPAMQAAAPVVEPAREIDVLSAAWEFAVTYPPAATLPGAGTTAAAAAPDDDLPSMWEAPPAASSTATKISEPEPADFLLEPLSMSAYANQPATAAAAAPPQEPADAMREIEEELFAAPPMQAATAAAPAAEIPPQHSVATPSAPAAPAASAAAPAVPRNAAAVPRPAARTMPRPALNDPLAALNAMSDEERIALFS